MRGCLVDIAVVRFSPLDESPPPTPKLLLFSNRSRVGFFFSSSSLIFWAKSSNSKSWVFAFERGIFYFYFLLWKCSDMLLWLGRKMRMFENFSITKLSHGQQWVGGECSGRTNKKGKASFWKPRKKFIWTFRFVKNWLDRSIHRFRRFDDGSKAGRFKGVNRTRLVIDRRSNWSDRPVRSGF